MGTHWIGEKGKEVNMPTDAMLWNKDKTESVRASKIRSFGIYEDHVGMRQDKKFKLLGWYNENVCFTFGFWDTEEEAGAYLEGLHKQIEGR